MGGTLSDGTVVQPKYIGSRRLMEVAVATLATDRALLLLGVPGTAKSWVSEHLAAAISGRSTLLVQGTSGTPEEAIRYGWNYARLLAEGPSANALVPSPVFTAMRQGSIVRVEELTRIPSDVQDALITVLSEKTLPIPELGQEVQATKGFNLIATANDRDKGVNELSSALRRRFNTVVLPLPADPEDEVRIVSARVAELAGSLELPQVPTAVEEIQRVVTVFRELRSGVTADGRTAVKIPVRHLVRRRGHLGDHQRAGAVRPLRRRDAAAGRCGRRDRGRGDQGSARRPDRLDGVSRGGGPRPTRVGASSTGLSRAGVTAPSVAEDTALEIFGIRHHGPGSARSLVAALERVRARPGADRGSGRCRPADRLGGVGSDIAAGGPAGLRRRPAQPGGVLAVRGVLAGMAGPDLGG